MSDDRGETGFDSLEGWSIVRHRDDVGSDADSVEVISDDSDRDTCDEGKEACDAEHKNEAADSTTKELASDLNGEEEVTTTSESELDSDLVRLDPLGDLTHRLSDKLHEFLLVPSHIHNDHSHQKLKLRYVIIASALLALICSLLVSSYLLFHKFQELPEKTDESSSAQVLQELEQAISRLQSVLRLENEQHLKDILSKIPPGYLGPEKMVSNGKLNKRKPIERSHTVPVMEMEDFGVVASYEETGAITSDLREVNVNELSSSENEIRTGSHDNGAKKSPGQKENEGYDAIDQPKSLDENMPLLIDRPLATETPDDPQHVMKAQIINSDSPKPEQEYEKDEKLDDSTLDNRNTSPKDTEMFNSDVKGILASIRQEVLAIQNQLYAQIMNSLFEYKIDLYKNLMRAGLDSTCSTDHSNKKSNHKKFMLMRNLQNMIAKSSESNFESWYKFYSYSVFPRFRTVFEQIDSIANKPGGESTVSDGVVNNDRDDVCHIICGCVGSDCKTVHPAASDGFDWKTLDKRIREIINRARITNQNQPVIRNQEKMNVEKENNSSSSDPSSESKEYPIGKKTNFSEINKKQDRGKIYKGEKAFEESPTNRSERSSKKEERKKTRDERKQQHTNNKNKKSTSKRDQINDDRTEFSKQDKKNNLKKQNGENYDFEKSKESRDRFGNGNVKYERRDKRSSGTKDNFDKKYCSGERCDKRGGKEDYYFHDGRPRRKSFLNNMSKYVKKAASGLWKTVRGGLKKVKNYGSYVKDWHTGEDKGKGNYEEWKKEFLKEMKDVIRVLGVNPMVNGLYELPKSVTRFFGDGLGNLINTEREWDEDMDVEGKGPAGVKLDECNTSEGGNKMGSYRMCSPDDSEDVKEVNSDSGTNSDREDEGVGKASWYTEAARHRAESRGESYYPDGRTRQTDPSWFLGLGRHRSYLRRRGIHLDDDGSWFISSARHRAKMRQRHTDSPTLPPHFASSKR